jgi:hypothetical protein
MRDELKPLSIKVMVMAGQKVGGAELAKHLGVDDEQLVRWLRGEEVASIAIISKALDLLQPGQ